MKQKIAMVISVLALVYVLHSIIFIPSQAQSANALTKFNHIDREVHLQPINIRGDHVSIVEFDNLANAHCTVIILNNNNVNMECK